MGGITVVHLRVCNNPPPRGPNFRWSAPLAAPVCTSCAIPTLVRATCLFACARENMYVCPRSTMPGGRLCCCTPMCLRMFYAIDALYDWASDHLSVGQVVDPGCGRSRTTPSHCRPQLQATGAAGVRDGRPPVPC